VSSLEKHVLEVLKQTSLASVEKISEELRRSFGIKAKLSEVFDSLLALERAGVVRRICDEEYDEYMPITTLKWQLLEAAAQPPSATEPSPPVEELWIVTSQPFYSSVRRALDRVLRENKVLTVEEAVHKVILDSERCLRVACPYYDEVFMSILYRAADKISSLREVRILYEEESNVLLKIRQILENVVAKRLLGREPVRGCKYLGMHAKMLIADESEVLLGSFNLRAQNIYYNFEVGVLIRGSPARHFKLLFDAVWDCI